VVEAAVAGAAAASKPPSTRASTKVGAETPEEVPELVLKGIEEFNKGEFYECHEYLEEAWMQEPRRVRFLYQGILQVGVGFYHQQNGNWRGATGLLRNGTVRLKEFEPVTLGIDVAQLVRDCERCLEELEELGRGRVMEFDQTTVPKVEWA
jgi:predicted metal-dependent hydrolase